MKKLFVLLLSLFMVFTMVGCSSEGEETADNSTGKIGIILVGDESEGYTYAHMKGIREAAEKLGIDESDIIWQYSIGEDQVCYDKAVECVEKGATLVISNSYGHQSYMQQAAIDNPDVQFVSCTGDTAAISGLDNFHNAFTGVYQSRYVSGVVAGMKIKELVDNGELIDVNYNEEGKVKIGYVGAFAYAEVVSGMTAFLLGVRSVYDNVEMYVDYTNSWFDITAEGTVADKLMSQGCVVISQHADSTGAPKMIQGNDESNKYGFKAYSVGYNVSMLDVAPDAALTSASNNWERYYEYAFNAWLNGEEIVTDWCKGYEDNAVEITELGSSCAAGTQEKVDEVIAALQAGTTHVFDVSTFTIDGATQTSILGDIDADFVPETECVSDGYFHESELRSAPYFNVIIDGITVPEE